MPKDPKEELINKKILDPLFQHSTSTIILSKQSRDNVRKKLRPALMQIDYDYLKENHIFIFNSLSFDLIVAATTTSIISVSTTVSNDTINEMLNTIQINSDRAEYVTRAKAASALKEEVRITEKAPDQIVMPDRSREGAGKTIPGPLPLIQAEDLKQQANKIVAGVNTADHSKINATPKHRRNTATKKGRG